MGEKTFQKQRCSSPFTIDVSDELWHLYYNAYCCSVLCATTTFDLEKQNDLESRLQTGVNLNFAILQFVWKATDDLSNIIEQAV